jgi:GH35 family endo-1,4-beta-xylanase
MRTESKYRVLRMSFHSARRCEAYTKLAINEYYNRTISKNGSPFFATP